MLSQTSRTARCPRPPSPLSMRFMTREPSAPLPARRALAARLVRIEVHEDREGPHHAGPFGDDDDAPDPTIEPIFASTRSRRHVDLVGRSTGVEEPPGITALILPVPHPPGVLLDDSRRVTRREVRTPGRFTGPLTQTRRVPPSFPPGRRTSPRRAYDPRDVAIVSTLFTIVGSEGADGGGKGGFSRGQPRFPSRELIGRSPPRRCMRRPPGER